MTYAVCVAQLEKSMLASDLSVFPPLWQRQWQGREGEAITYPNPTGVIARDPNTLTRSRRTLAHTSPLVQSNGCAVQIIVVGRAHAWETPALDRGWI